MSKDKTKRLGVEGLSWAQGAVLLSHQEHAGASRRASV